MCFVGCTRAKKAAAFPTWPTDYSYETVSATHLEIRNSASVLECLQCRTRGLWSGCGVNLHATPEIIEQKHPEVDDEERGAEQPAVSWP